MRLKFADCELDVSAHSLRRNGQEVRIEPQVFDLIACVANARGGLVTYDDLITKVWGGRIVSDATVAARVSSARTAIGDDGKRQGILRTIPRRGIQLVVAVTESNGIIEPPESASTQNRDRKQTIRYTTSKDGTGIAWASSGDGPLLLRAGHWMSHLEHDWTSPVWQPFVDRLSSKYTLVRYDPRGTGLSDRTLKNATVEALADEMEAVADAAGLKTFPIFATSQSVPVALVFAARHPNRVRRLALFNGLVRGSTARGENEHTEAMLAMIKTGWGQPGSPFMRAISTLFVPEATRQEIDSLMEMQALSASGDIAAELRRTIGAIDVSECLSKVTCPTLVVHSSGDQVQPAEESRLLARKLQDAEYATINSQNHILVPSDPNWSHFLAKVEAFLSA